MYEISMEMNRRVGMEERTKQLRASVAYRLKTSVTYQLRASVVYLLRASVTCTC